MHTSYLFVSARVLLALSSCPVCVLLRAAILLRVSCLYSVYCPAVHSYSGRLVLPSLPRGLCRSVAATDTRPEHPEQNSPPRPARWAVTDAAACRVTAANVAHRRVTRRSSVARNGP